jgi:hypothetical protein
VLDGAQSARQRTEPACKIHDQVGRPALSMQVAETFAAVGAWKQFLSVKMEVAYKV